MRTISTYRKSGRLFILRVTATNNAWAREVRARLSFMSVPAYDWPVTAPQRTLLKERIVLIAVALVGAGLAMGLHRLIQ